MSGEVDYLRETSDGYYEVRIVVPAHLRPVLKQNNLTKRLGTKNRAYAKAPSGSTPVGSGTRPQTRLSYTQLYAYYRQSSGGGVAIAPTGVYQLTATSSCATSSSCSGGSDETATTIGYGSTGVANNRLPLTVSAGAGNGSLTATVSNTFDNIGNLTEVDGPLSGTGDTTKLVYDAARRRLGVIGPDPDSGGSLLNRAVRYNYDGHGWVSSLERGTASGGTWANFSALETLNVGYDGAGRRIQQSFVAGGSTHAVTQFSYDSASRLECVAVRMNPSEFGSLPSSACTLDTEGANGSDRITRNAYDVADRITTVTSGYGTSVQQNTLVQSYTNNGLVATLQDANSNLTTYEYDGFDRTSKIRFPNASGGGSSTSDYEQYTYDANSNVTQDRRRDGATITFAYDNLNRASTMTPSTGDVVSYTYDNFSRMTQAAYTGHALTFGYDQLSRNTNAGGPLGTVSYQYDSAGRRTRITWPDSFCAQYAYDLTNAVTQISAEGGACTTTTLATYAYDNLGRRTSVTRGNGTTTSYDYDAAGRLEELAQNLASTANDVTFNFTYNASSQAITRERTTSNSGYVWPQPANSTQNSTANGLNQVAQLAGTNFTYDGRGNLTSTGTATYGYDIYNRLTSAGSATMAYDPGGRLYQTTSNGSTVTARLQYEGNDLIAVYNSLNALQRRYVHGPGTDEPVVWYEGSGTSDRRWLHQDQLGSVVAASDSSGALIGSPNTYDEYGVPGSSNVGRFQYTGQTWVPEASVFHFKARAYAPSLGRFMQSDPILYGGGMNIYSYVLNDPTNGVDPMGTCQRWRRDYWNRYSDGHIEWVRSETYTVGCTGSSGTTTPTGNGENGASDGEEEEEEPQCPRSDSGIVQAVPTARTTVRVVSGFVVGGTATYMTRSRIAGLVAGQAAGNAAGAYYDFPGQVADFASSWWDQMSEAMGEFADAIQGGDIGDYMNSGEASEEFDLPQPPC